MATKSDFQFGDILATRSNSFLSKGIRWMLHWYKKYADGFSHNAVVVNMWGELWIAEALAWGVRLHPIEKSGYLTEKGVIILREKRGFSEFQIDKISKKMASLAGTRYQYENLLQWIAYIFFRIKRIFKPSNEKAIYCSELAAIAINEAYPGTFTHPNMVSPADHVSSKIYDTIDINHIL